MNLKDCFYLGKIGKPKSFKGEVFFHFDNDTPQLYDSVNAFYILIGRRLIKYTIDKFYFKNPTVAVIKFIDVDDEDGASMIKNLEVYLPNSLLPKLDNGEIYLHDLVGCEVNVNGKGVIGTIKSINENAAQKLLFINEGVDEILVPYIPEFVDRIDAKAKTIYMNLPQGLIDINE